MFNATYANRGHRGKGWVATTFGAHGFNWNTKSLVNLLTHNGVTRK
jgi:hypothetical protein